MQFWFCPATFKYLLRQAFIWKVKVKLQVTDEQKTHLFSIFNLLRFWWMWKLTHQIFSRTFPIFPIYLSKRVCLFICYCFLVKTFWFVKVSNSFLNPIQARIQSNNIHLTKINYVNNFMKILQYFSWFLSIMSYKTNHPFRCSPLSKYLTKEMQHSSQFQIIF